MSNNEKYLFIRILEACNADCFMCDFAKSNDKFRFGVEDLKAMLPTVYNEGIRYIRFTGGEPLMHKQIVELIQAITDQGIKSSIITNGTILEQKAEALAQAGLDQVIVSIDGQEKTHDALRGTPGLFKRGIAGLEAAKRLGIKLRVNSVVGPDNFREMPELQNLFTEMGVEQWEMSSLKLEDQKLNYKDGDRELIENTIIPTMFERASEEGKLIPFGKIWCGDNKAERDLYFATGITPRADGVCHVVDHVRYLDAKNGKLYTCSLTPHRVGNEDVKMLSAFVNSAENLSTKAKNVEAQADFFRKAGPKSCTGCSTTAAGFSNRIARGEKLEPWSY